MSDEALIEKNAVEIVKQMQRLKNIDGDGDYASDILTPLGILYVIPTIWKKTLFRV